MSRTYSRGACHFCRQDISIGGLGHSSHMRMHIRKGEAIGVLHRFGHLGQPGFYEYTSYYPPGAREKAQREADRSGTVLIDAAWLETLKKRKEKRK